MKWSCGEHGCRSLRYGPLNDVISRRHCWLRTLGLTGLTTKKIAAALWIRGVPIDRWRLHPCITRSVHDSDRGRAIPKDAT